MLKPRYVFLGTLLLTSAIGIWRPILPLVRAYNAPLPQPAIIDLPNFSGRILPGEQVHSDTFSISVPMEKIDKPNAIASYRVNEKDFLKSGVVIEAWMPDDKTPGVFQKAIIMRSSGEIWNSPHIRVFGVSTEGGKIIVHPGRNSLPLYFAIIFGGFFLLILALCTASFYSKLVDHKRLKKTKARA